MIIIKGQIACPGKSTGQLLYITECSTSNGNDNIIIVVPSSNPIYTPALLTAAGLVICYGGVLAHLASIARELCLPCIVGCPEAEQWARIGAKAELDANQGVLKIFS